MADTDPDRGEFLARGSKQPRKPKACGPAPATDPTEPPFEGSKPVEPAQALTVMQRAENAIGFVQTKAKLVELVGKSATITAITDKAGYDLVHASYMVLKNTRVAVEKLGKSARDEANQFRAAVIAKEDELVAIITPEENRLLAMRKVVDDEAERVKAERVEAERKRRQEFEDEITIMRGAAIRTVGGTADDIAFELAILERDVLSRFDDEYLPAAQRARDDAIELLRRMLAERKQLDADRAELERGRAEQAKRQAELDAEAARQEADRKAAQAEQERLQAIEDQKAADARAEAARIERERQDAEDRRLAAERAEAQRIEDERLAAERAEAERVRLEQQAAEDAERKRLQAEQDEANRLERERLAQEAEDLRLKLEAAEAERLRMEDETIERATLVDASRGALALLVNEGYARRIETRTLRAALAKLPKGTP